jgi:TatD DNase family protein
VDPGVPSGRSRLTATARGMILYTDTHCHLDQFRDPTRVLDESPNTVVVAVTELPSRYRLAAARFRTESRVRVALGLHPLRAATAGPLEEGHLMRLLPTANYVGEVGLDFSRLGQPSKRSQVRVLDRLLAEPALRYKVVSIHSRGAEKLTINLFREAGVVGTLHWYTGPRPLIDEALAGGLYFSVNPAMLRSTNGLNTITALPQDRVLTESDGPFAQVQGHDASPRDMPWLVKQLARHWAMDPVSAQAILHNNLAALYASTVGKRTTELASDISPSSPQPPGL